MPGFPGTTGALSLAASLAQLSKGRMVLAAANIIDALFRKLRREFIAAPLNSVYLSLLVVLRRNDRTLFTALV
jgi:hypothetical protein